MLIDAHTHLNDPRLVPEVAALVARMREAGVCAALVVGYDLDSSRCAVSLAQQFSGVLHAAIGVHPHESRDLEAATIEALRALAAEPGVVALGEIGLDYHYDHSPRSIQREAFRRQLALAAEVELPVVIHEREAVDDVLSILDDEDGWSRGGEWHCCSVPTETALRIARHFYLGLAGWITFPKAANLHALAQAVPLERVLLETDAPYISPVPFRGKTNEPAYLRYTAQALAQAKGISIETVEEITTENTRRAFPRWTAP